MEISMLFIINVIENTATYLGFGNYFSIANC